MTNFIVVSTILLTTKEVERDGEPLGLESTTVITVPVGDEEVGAELEEAELEEAVT